VRPNAIKSWAIGRGLPVFQPEKLTDEVRAQLAAFAPDLALVMAYGHILRDAFIATPRLGTLNLHTSLLPKYRGASPIQTAIANGETETGVSLMRIVRELDAGPVADVEHVPISPRDTALDVEAKLAAACVPLLARTLPALAAGTLKFLEQDHSAATFCRKLQKEDGVLDFTAPAAVLAARINGLNPWPGCTVEIAGQMVKFGLADTVGQSTSDWPPGTILDPARVGLIAKDATGMLIATGQDLLRVLRLQRPGGKMLPGAEFMRGFHVPSEVFREYPATPGAPLQSFPMPVLVANAPFRR
jgi:methionyl-tRNA formyltransferase